MTISLQTITLCNFKSYLGEIIMGPFHPFMTIIGPNGSGKSNIVDAVRFVLGEVLSVLRVKRFSELVYGGTTGKPAAESTYVTLTFLINDNEEKSFTRMIQGEESLYKIDNEIVTSKLYMTTLQEYGLDIKSEHFLVAQGYIECIAMKTPKELNAIFEQISGSYVYKANYKRLKMKLVHMENKIQFVQHMKKQLLMNKKYTVIEKEEAERFLKLQQQYKKEKLQYQLVRLFLIKRTVEILQNENTDIKSRKEEYLRDKRNAMIVLERKKLQFKSFTDSLEDVEKKILKLEEVIQKQKTQYTVLKESISHWQKKRDCARVSVESASLARDTNKKTIKELKNELKQTAKKLAKIEKVSEQGAVELSNSQVKQYFELKNTIECQAKDFIKQINSLIRDQEVDRDHLDNENRRKQELEDKTKQTSFIKEDLETRLRKLQNVIVEFKMVVTEKATKKQELNDKIIETNNKSLSLKDDIAKILEKLNEIDVDNYTISQQKEKAETIKMLKQLCPGVYNRLSNLCKPVHSRYKIAVIKVFGKLMDAIVVDTTNTAIQCMEFLKLQKIGVETFLPLDSLKREVLKEKLRDIKQPNVKLLYDILDILSPQIDKAVLFVTKSTLVCETPEDASKVAYEIDRQNHDCVSLDGSFYRKDGTISGGMVDLINRVKQWEERNIITLKEQREQLKKELQNLPNVSLLQSELSVIDTQFKELNLKNNFIEKDLKDTEDKVTRIHKELIEYDTELFLSNEKISKIQHDMQARDEELENVKKHVSTIENSVFANFCRNINVPDIEYYEKNNLRTCQEQKKRQIELENQYDLIQNQLRFEKDRNMEDKILNWTRIAEQADTKLTEMHQQELSTNKTIEQEEEKLSKLREECAIVKENLVNMENGIAQCKSQIDVISKMYLETRRADIIVQRKIGQQKDEWDNVLKECKMEDITIPILSERLSSKSGPSSSSSFTDSSVDWDMSKLKIDFSQFPRSISDSKKENLEDMAKQLNGKLTEIQNELEAIINPNLKAQENMDSVMQEIQEINEKLKKLREKTNRIKKEFEIVKMKRFNLFSECLDCVAAEIDSVYKSLVSHTTASAFILSDNPEEPYEGGINYSCIAPSKRFQPLQNLSGGEKTLAGLALLFAFQRYKPAPFFIMDESDAALDNVNIKNVVSFIQSQTQTTQFIIVTLQKILYFRSDALIGVTTEPDTEYTQSKIVAISLKEYKDKLDENMDKI